MTKTKLKALAKEILNRYSLNSVIDNQNDIDVLIGIFERHPDWSIKLGSGLRYITIRTVLPYKTRCFVIVRVDGTETDISYGQALDGARSKIGDIKCACRNAIMPIIIDYAKSVDLNTAVCAISGVKLTSTNIHIDHFDFTFDELFKLWVSTQDIDVLYSNLNDGKKDNEVEVFFTNREFIESFKLFHNSHTNLRAVTRTANLSLLKRK